MASTSNTVTLSIEANADLGAFQQVQRELDELRETTVVDVDTSSVDDATSSTNSLQSAFNNLDFDFSPLTVGALALGAGIGAAVVAFNTFRESAEILVAIDNLLLKSGRAAEINGRKIEQWSLSMGGSLEDARIGIRGLLDSELDTSEIERLIPLLTTAAKLSEEFDIGDFRDFGKLFDNRLTGTGIIAELSTVNGQLSFMSERAMDAAMEMAKLGRVAEAEAIIFEALERSYGETFRSNPAAEFNKIGKGLTIATEKLGEFIAIKTAPFAKQINIFLSELNASLDNNLSVSVQDQIEDRTETLIRAIDRLRSIQDETQTGRNKVRAHRRSGEIKRLEEEIEASKSFIKQKQKEQKILAGGGTMQRVFEIDEFQQADIDGQLRTLRDTAAKQSGFILSDIAQLVQDKEQAIRDAVLNTIQLVDTLATKKRTGGKIDAISGDRRALNNTEQKQLNESIASQKQYFETIKGFSLQNLESLKSNGQLQTTEEIGLINSLIASHREFDDGKKDLSDRAITRQEKEYEKAVSVGAQMLQLFKDNEKKEFDIAERQMQKSLDLFEFELDEKDRLLMARKTLTQKLVTAKDKFIPEDKSLTGNLTAINDQELNINSIAKELELSSALTDIDKELINTKFDLKAQSISDMMTMDQSYLQFMMDNSDSLTDVEKSSLQQRIDAYRDFDDERREQQAVALQKAADDGDIYARMQIASTSLMTNLWSDFATEGIGAVSAGISQSLWEQEDLGKSLENTLGAVGRQFINTLVKIGVQKSVMALLDITLGKKVAGSKVIEMKTIASASGPAAIGTTLATGGISAASSLIMMGVATAGMMMLLNGLSSGKMHAGGKIPQMPGGEGSFLLRSGEYVSSPNETKLMESFVSQQRINNTNTNTNTQSDNRTFNVQLSAIDGDGMSNLLDQYRDQIYDMMQEDQTQAQERYSR